MEIGVCVKRVPTVGGKIVLGVFFPGRFWTAAAPLSLCVAVGGAAWAAVYQRSGSLLGPWLSHLIVDAAIMAVGYDLADPSPVAIESGKTATSDLKLQKAKDLANQLSSIEWINSRKSCSRSPASR